MDADVAISFVPITKEVAVLFGPTTSALVCQQTQAALPGFLYRLKL